MNPAPPTVSNGTSLSAILGAVAHARRTRPTVPLALATLVNVEGSSYRQPGARLLIDAEQGVLAGAISGGCLEGDVAARAAAVCGNNGAVLLRYDLREDLETMWGFGAGCDGIAHVLLEPLTNDAWMHAAHEAVLARTSPVLITVFNSDDPAMSAGSHQVVPVADLAGQSAHIRTPLATGQPYVGLATRGRFTDSVLCEPLLAPVALHIIGAGPGAEAFATIAVAMGWRVTVVDHRPMLLAALQLPEAAGRLVRRAEQGLDDRPLDSRTVVAILTHIFDVDVAWLRTLLPTLVAYVGVLGSRSRAARLLEHVATTGVDLTPEMQRRVYAPIGLDLGGESPESIALAGVAEMEAVLHGRPGGFLRSRQSPIHTRTVVPVTRAVDATIESCTVTPGAGA